MLSKGKQWAALHIREEYQSERVAEEEKRTDWAAGNYLIGDNRYHWP